MSGQTGVWAAAIAAGRRAPSAAPASTAGPAGTNVAALTPPTAPADLNRSVQTELGRVGCFSGSADGNWNTSSQRSLSQFNRYAGTKLDVKVASTDALDAVKAKPARVCPLVCEHGFKADGDKCTKIVCREGYAINDDNECEKRRGKKPTVARERPEPRRHSDQPRRNTPEARHAEGTKRVYITGSQGGTGGAGIGANGRPLTGQDRAIGCHSFGAIMSGVCP